MHHWAAFLCCSWVCWWWEEERPRANLQSQREPLHPRHHHCANTGGGPAGCEPGCRVCGQRQQGGQPMEQGTGNTHVRSHHLGFFYQWQDTGINRTTLSLSIILCVSCSAEKDASKASDSCEMGHCRWWIRGRKCDTKEHCWYNEATYDILFV